MNRRVFLIVAVVAPLILLPVWSRWWQTDDWASGTGPVQPEQLAALIDRADRVVVVESGEIGARVLFTSSDRRDLDALKAAARVVAPEQFRQCKCHGTEGIVLYAGRRKIGHLSNQHARAVRCSLWASDALVVDPDAWVRWFDDRRIPGPRREYEEGEAEARKTRESERRWVEAMPPALRPFWPEFGWNHGAAQAAMAALEVQIPNPQERILALLGWYGSGEGPWSGYPSYESDAATFLRDFPTQEIVKAVEGTALTPAQTEGAARLLAGLTHSRGQPDALRLPDGLRARLLEHSLASPDEDRRSRARWAFGAAK